MTWKQDLLAQLQERDQRSRKDDGIFRSFAFMADKMKKQAHELDLLRKDDVKQKYYESVKAAEVTQHKLETQEKTIGKLGKQTKLYQKELDLVRKECLRLKNRSDRLEEESAIKNQNIEGINDSVLSLQIENNLLTTQIDKLKKENDQLVKRWMARVEKDVDVINQANEVLQKNQ